MVTAAMKLKDAYSLEEKQFVKNVHYSLLNLLLINYMKNRTHVQSHFAHIKMAEIKLTYQR